MPRKEATGQVQLPLSRVKKIIALDQDVHVCSSNAAFVITLATEMFIQYMTEQGHNVAKAEKKPRRNVQYKDLASAVSRLDSLEFLVDVVPRTETYRIVKARKMKAEKAASSLISLRSRYAPASNGKAGGASTPRNHGKDATSNGETALASSLPGEAANGRAQNHECAQGDETEDEDPRMHGLVSGEEDPTAQLQAEIRGHSRTDMGHDGDVTMT